jgi:hypothetical protein
MHFFEFLTIAMAFSTGGFIVHSFFSYLKFRRTNAIGGGKTKDYEELAEAFQHYIRKTNKRIEHLEAINTQTDVKYEQLAEQDEHDFYPSGGLKNRLENR